MYDEIFKEINLTVVELPIELVEEKPHYSAYLKELPFISAQGNSRQEMYKELVQQYQIYVENNTPEEEGIEQEEITSSLLTTDQLLKYYDGETFDGFSLPD